MDFSNHSQFLPVQRDNAQSVCLGRSTRLQEEIFYYSFSVSSFKWVAVGIGVLGLMSVMAGVTTHSLFVYSLVKSFKFLTVQNLPDYPPFRKPVKRARFEGCN